MEFVNLIFIKFSFNYIKEWIILIFIILYETFLYIHISFYIILFCIKYHTYNWKLNIY